jgi:tRNA threonylcarbamoyladenosine biosynthesis protein TsaB
MADGRTILAFDSSGAACSAAVWADGAIAARRFEPMVRGQAERLMPMIRAAMADARRGFAELDLIAVTVGPGSFTGLRVGLAAARGLALAGNVPAAGVTSFDAALEALPAAATAGRAIAIALDSKRGDLFVQFYDPGRRALAEPRILPPPAVLKSAPPGPLYIGGDGAALMARHAGSGDLMLAPAGALIDAAHVAALAARRELAALLPPVPLYLRAADVTMPGRRGAATPGATKGPAGR